MIEVNDLSFSYQDAPVLEHIGFTVQTGELVALIGANGTGKSTLLRLLLGELPLQSGKISLFGQELGHFRDWWRVAYVPQDSVSLAEGFPANVLEIVSLSLYRERRRRLLSRAAARERALRALELVDMLEYVDRPVGKLSGGQIQRVMLARALAAGSELLLLDEPSNGMDAQSVSRLYELLRELSEKGMTIVLVTHDLVRAGQVAGRILCLDRDNAMHLSHPGHDVCCIHHEPEILREDD